MISITVDMEGQILKSSALRAVPKAFRRNASEWAAGTLRYIKQGYQGGGGNFSSFKRAPKEIDQRLGMKVTMPTPESATIVLGTGGVIGKREVVYAKIQDEGGTIKGKDKFFRISNLKGRPRMGPFLSIPLGNTKGRVANYRNTFNIRSKSGNFLVMQSSVAPGSHPDYRRAVFDPMTGLRERVNPRERGPKARLKALFLLRLKVTLPPRRWFTGRINQRRPELDRMMSPDAVMATAERMAQAKAGGEG